MGRCTGNLFKASIEAAVSRITAFFSNAENVLVRIAQQIASAVDLDVADVIGKGDARVLEKNAGKIGFVVPKLLGELVKRTGFVHVFLDKNENVTQKLHVSRENILCGLIQLAVEQGAERVQKALDRGRVILVLHVQEQITV